MKSKSQMNQELINGMKEVERKRKELMSKRIGRIFFRFKTKKHGESSGWNTCFLFEGQTMEEAIEHKLFGKKGERPFMEEQWELNRDETQYWDYRLIDNKQYGKIIEATSIY